MTNYSPTIKSSVFQKVDFNKNQELLKLNDSQLSFKKQHLTMTACFILEETFLSYLKFNILVPF